MIFAGFSQSDEGRRRQLICTVARENLDYEANAQLIASAPELLEACKKALRDFPDYYHYNDVRKKIKQAITKAEGKK